MTTLPATRWLLWCYFCGVVWFRTAVTAAPALVWHPRACSHDGSSVAAAVVHSSEEIAATKLFASLLSSLPDAVDGDAVARDASSLSSSPRSMLVFLLGRGRTEGHEMLTSWAETAQLPGIMAHYQTHSCPARMLHHVTGMTDAPSILRDIRKAAGSGDRVMRVSLPEYQDWLVSMSDSVDHTVELDAQGAQKPPQQPLDKKRQEWRQANIRLVFVDSDQTDPAQLDAAVVQALQDTTYSTVVLCAVRSVEEVKQEQEMELKRRFLLQEAAGRALLEDIHRRNNAHQPASRRLEENMQGQNNNDFNMNGVYYVSLTPNILAGILFFFLFTFITYVGIGCMGMISGQDVFVTKIPSIGREA